MPLKPTHPYKQPLEVWINSKQDGDLTNTNGKKKNTKTRVDNQIYVETPCGKKPTGDGVANHYEMKQYKRWETTRMGRLQIFPRISLSIRWIWWI